MLCKWNHTFCSQTSSTYSHAPDVYLCFVWLDSSFLLINKSSIKVTHCFLFIYLFIERLLSCFSLIASPHYLPLIPMLRTESRAFYMLGKHSPLGYSSNPTNSFFIILNKPSIEIICKYFWARNFSNRLRKYQEVNWWIIW